MKASNGEALQSAGTDSNVNTGNSFYSSSIRAVRSSVGWRLIPVFIATLVLIPVGTVVSSLFAPAGDVWQHLVETTLAELLVNTFWLAVGVSLGVRVNVGVSLGVKVLVGVSLGV